MIKLIECPRDAMQGLSDFIPTETKANYINQLLKVGFHTIDFGSFVSPKAIPQMRDTQEVLSKLDLSHTSSKLLAIVANYRGAEAAAVFPEIAYLGYPLSISETFQRRNTNRGIAESMQLVAEIQALCERRDKKLVVYISMGFGNPYGDPYSPAIVEEFVEKLKGMGIQIISLADTVGASQPEQIQALFGSLAPRFPDIEMGVHLHAHPAQAQHKIEAAYQAGCRRFDGALLGFGGCPMAEDELVGNIATESLVAYFEQESVALGLDTAAWQEAKTTAAQVFLS